MDSYMMKVPAITSASGRKAFPYRRPVHWNGIDKICRNIEKFNRCHKYPWWYIPMMHLKWDIVNECELMFHTFDLAYIIL